MCETGVDFEFKLRAALRLIWDLEMESALRASDIVDSRLTPLLMAVLVGKVHIVEAMLEISPSCSTSAPPLPDSHILQKAMDSHSQALVEILIEHGVNVLDAWFEDSTGAEQGNLLHYSAQFFPRVLLQLIATLEVSSPDRLGGKSVKEILELPDRRGWTVFGLLLCDGYSDERQIAEYLRVKYGLEYDNPKGSRCSLTATLITLSNVGGLMDISQIRYLLSLTPKPNFLCGDGGTLLGHAVRGPLQSKDINF
jgi:hypothetical protein